jgi:chromosome segregation ATPase
LRHESNERTKNACEQLKRCFDQDLSVLRKENAELKRQKERSEEVARKLDEKQSLLVMKERVIQDLSDQLEELREHQKAETNASHRLEAEKRILASDKTIIKSELDQLRSELEEKEKVIQYITSEIETIKEEFSKKLAGQESVLRAECVLKVAEVQTQLREAADALRELEKALDSEYKTNDALKEHVSKLENEKVNISHLCDKRLQKLTAIVTALSDNDL